MPPRPRPSIGPTIQPASHFRSPDVSPERPPGQWQPSSFTAPSQRPVLPRFRPPPSKSQAEDPLLRAAEMFSNPTSGSDSNKPAAPSGASVAHLQKTTASKTPPKHPAPEGSQKPPAAAPVISVDDEQMFQATQQLRTAARSDFTAHMPGPEPQANCFYCWGHGTTAEGLVGILTLGRVLRSSAEAVQVAPRDDVSSFYGKATQDVHYEPSKLDFISKLHHGTKNSAGVVVGGFMGTPHHNSKSSSTVHEGHLCKFHAPVQSPSGDRRWAVREAAGRIDRIWVLSSTHSAQLPNEQLQ